MWGNTLQQATEAYMSHQAMEAQSIRRLAELLDEAIPADLPGLVTMMTKRLDELSASAGDVGGNARYDPQAHTHPALRLCTCLRLLSPRGYTTG